MRKRRNMIAKALFGALLALSGPVVAQEAATTPSVGVVQSLILTIEPDRLFSDSAFGQRIVRDIETEGNQIASDNRRIEAELTQEERELTELRDTLTTEEFRERASAFDEKVQELRRTQDEKARALGQRSDEARRALLAAAQPVLLDLMADSGAVAILDRRAVLLSVSAVDITDRAIARVDATIGDGSDIFE